METKYDQFIAGGGIGGLISAAILAKNGQKTLLVERLPFLGGRFTSFRYQGFEIPTGAVHTIPHSRKGPLGKILLEELKLPLDVQSVENFTAWYWPDRKPIRHRSFWGIFKAFPSASQRLFVIRKLLLDARKSEQYSESFHDYLESRTEDPQIFQFFNAVTGFALSLNISQISTASMFRVLKRLYERGRPGVPIGGCKAVIRSLASYINTINEIDGEKVKKVICRDLSSKEEFEVQAKEFIFNLGPMQIQRIMSASNLPYQLPSAPIARGGGFCFRSKRSILGSSAIAQFPENKYIKGAVEPTTISPDLAPSGEHLLITHQVFHSADIKQDCKKAREELLSTFPQLEEEDELCVHTYHKDWPVNYVSQGNDLSNFHAEIPNLYFVGDGYKGNQGWMMTEGIAYGVKKVVNKILSN
jgi:phytoene dehydrogenase-like protein